MRSRLSRQSLAKRAGQRGVVLLFSLIALVIMLIVAVALVRSFNSSLFTAGNIGFKRDLQNQSERAVDLVLNRFLTDGQLGTPIDRQANKGAMNYSATMLTTNAEGIPDVFQSNSAFSGAGFTDADIEPSGMGVKIRYVVDRLCSAAGNETTLTPGQCRLADNPVPAGTSLTNLQGAERTINGKAGAAPQGVVYRLSIRVTGPRNTQSFFQSTFTIPSSI